MYILIAGRVAAGGGKVPVKNFDLADVVVGALLALFFILPCFLPPAKEKGIHDSDLIANAVVYLTLVTFLCSFMFFRRFDLAAQFGLNAMNPFKVPAFSVALLAAAYPLLLLVGIIVDLVLQKLHGAEPQPQELMQFFSDAVRKHDHRAVAYMFLTATLIAPLTEELIFRGYFHGILKRYIGVAAGVVLNAALFACIHQSLPALPGLFLLAICLTLAYEFTGSILVNMGMHSLFNFCSLMYAYYHPLAPAT
ncbi:MAG TPA: CPBP family intramembrane glutamic endopeptidase [Chthoniobacteraceae bacterium]|nr:CPBP family intramembrane glutamic endopeptidase [Chthoniobacteraceae bacterium]